VSNLRPLDGVAGDILFYRPCARCQQAFLYCRGREPGRRYCGESCATEAKEVRERKARKKYRASPEGQEQHRDEEAERRERHRQEAVGDRRLGPASCEVQRVASASPYAHAVEEGRGEPGEDEGERVEWVLVAWPGVLAAAGALLGAEVECPGCGRRGPVVRVVSLAEWRGEEGR
jgi:hypothetical protein